MNRSSQLSGPIWSATNTKTSVQNAFGHWKIHGKEFPELLNSKQYVEYAHSMIKNTSGRLTKIRPNGEIVCYQPTITIFSVFNKNGAPKTMFKPDLCQHNFPTNLDYFYGQ